MTSKVLAARTDSVGDLDSTWLPALADARAGTRLATVLWFGDSISELDPSGIPLPWYVGRVLSGWTETVQYRNAGAEFTPSMETTGVMASDDRAGLGGHSVDLEPGQSCTLSALGQGVTILWTRRRGAGSLAVTWGGDHLGTIDTDGDVGASQFTTFRRSAGFLAEPLTVTAEGSVATLEGVYLHDRNVDHGVRVWPAARSGNTTQDFLDHPSWGLDAIGTLKPDLVVVATGTNVATSYADELDEMIKAVRARTAADLVIWIPFLNSSFTAEEAAQGRLVAESHGCTVIDAAAVLGIAPTVDGAHPNAVGTALAGAHASAALSGQPLEVAVQIAGQAVASLRGGQQWRPGVGAVAVDAPVGSSVLWGKGHQDDDGHEWVLILDQFAREVLGLPGASLSFGPGGSDPVDTHLSRGGPAHLVVNRGAGQVDLARLRFLPADGGEMESVESGAVTLQARRLNGRTELVVVDAGGEARRVVSEADTAVGGGGGYCAPVPCALAPPHQPSSVGAVLTRGRVVWLPMPVMASAVLVTDLWVDVLEPGSGAVASMGVALGDGAGRPGGLARATVDGAVDLGEPGVRGASLTEPVLVRAGERWWVAVMACGGTEEGTVAAAQVLDGVPPVCLGDGPSGVPVVPSPAHASGALTIGDQQSIPAEPGQLLSSLSGPIPVVYSSLQGP